MRLSPYPEYKSSNIEWLGDIPSAWNINRLKFVAPIQNARTEERSADLDYLALEHIESGTGRVLEKSNTLEVDSVVSLFHKGDILFSKLRPYLAKVVYADFDGACTSELLVFRPDALLVAHYLFYFLLSDRAINTVNSFSYGTKMPRVNWEQIANLPVPIASLGEQQAIADFLDRETAVIDTLIARKRELIERLQEKRTALISHTVTKGLDPTVPMKDSGIAWPNEIPDHWVTVRLKFKCDVKARLGWRGLKASEYTDDGFVFLSTPNIKEDEIDFENVNYISEERYYESPEIILREGYVLLAKDGSTLGITNVVRKLPRPATVNSSIAVLKPSSTVDSVFLYYYLSSNYIQSLIAQFKDGMGVPHLFQADIREFLLLIPPISEQELIAKYLDEKVKELNQLVTKVNQAIECLREYRTALISAAVTGKIDVRSHAQGGV